MQIGDKLNEIYTDLSTNVTRIYGRQNLHLAIDLVYHSPLQFYFGKRKVDKGFPELLVLGDTRCGKSETAKCLLQHYRLGARSSGENASFSGLVGGLDQVRGRWRVSWGRIPLNHKRLLFIDEVCGLTHDHIGAMSDIRSSGIAEINKIRIEQTHARTRLVWLSNPREKSPISNIASGPSMIEHLIGKPEDIARFDFVLILDKREVDAVGSDERLQPDVEHVYTSDLCHDLVLWAWSRNPEQVRLDSATVDACHDFGALMCSKYSSDCPIVNSMEQKIKLARLAVALACRLFSTKDGHTVHVTPEHVKYVHDFLNQEYDRPQFSFDVYSRRVKIAEKIKDKDEVVEMLSKWSEAFLFQLIDGYQITVKFIEESTGAEYNDAKVQLAKLLRNGCLTKKHNFYVKTNSFINVLKEYVENPVPNKEDF
jgi:hypothetical protein